MKVYGYVRLSRDEDNRTRESLETQKKIIKSYAKENNMNLIEIIEDDNVSGYKFNRLGLNKLKNLIEEGEVDILLVKDLSRIGRHNAKTLLFLDYLEEYNVRLIMINENYDSEKDSDDIIGIKTWYNERYVKDISKKIKANIRQKQKEEGLVIIPPFGYMKDDDGKVVIDEESANTVKKIFELYSSGYGTKNITKILNENNYKTPMQRKRELYKGFGNKSYKTYYLWYSTTINRILKNDAYIGILRCGKTKLEKMKGKKIHVPKEEHIIHENYYPPIIDKKTFEKVQEIIENRKHNNVRAKNKKIHTYAGLLYCVDCNNTFVAKRYKTKTCGEKVRYVCATYHKFGKKYCSPHSINEDMLNQIVYDALEELRKTAKINLDKIDKEIQKRLKNNNSIQRSIDKTKQLIFNKKEEIKEYAKQLAKNLITEEIFKELTNETKSQLKILEEQLKEMRIIKENESKIKNKTISAIETLDEIIKNKDLNNSKLSQLINKIYIKEKENGELDINVEWSIPIEYNEVTLSCDDVTLLLHSINQLVFKIA